MPVPHHRYNPGDEMPSRTSDIIGVVSQGPVRLRMRSRILHGCMGRRCLHKLSNTSSVLKKLRASIEEVKRERLKAVEAQREDVKLVKSKSSERSFKRDSIDLLNEKYKGEFKDELSAHVIGGVTHFFTKAYVKLEWTTAKFLDIPGEQKRLEQERVMASQQEENEPVDVDFKIKKAGLPEIVFLGKCNVGKSSLLNALLTSRNAKQNLEFAWASRRAGFTQTMNCFNVGNRFNLIDTPGYGVKGKMEQGEQVMEYLHRRKELRRVYLLIGAEEGFSQDDFTIIDMLLEAGVPFEIVFTKLDKLRKTSKVEQHIKNSGVLTLPSQPSLIFTNSEVNKYHRERHGFEILRWSIFEACGLPYSTKPLKVQ